MLSACDTGRRSGEDNASTLSFSLEDKMARLGTMPLDEYITWEITRPLGMNSTHFFLPDELHCNLVTAYVANPDSTVVPVGNLGGMLYHPDYPISGARSYCSGGSGLC